MNRRRLASGLGALIFAGVSAYFLRDAIGRYIVIPLTYFWWLLTLVYRTIPQFLTWSLLVAAVVLSALNILSSEVRFEIPRVGKVRPTAGPVEEMARWIHKTGHGNYYKWLVANRIGRLARELLAQRDGHSTPRPAGPLMGRDWKPSPEVESYLEVGVNGSFADYPLTRWRKAQPTPLDLDPNLALDFLESELEDG